MKKYIKKYVLHFLYIILFISLAYFLYNTKLYEVIHKLPCLSISFSIIVTAFIIYLKNPKIFSYKKDKDTIIFSGLIILFLIMLPLTELTNVFMYKLYPLDFLLWLYYVILLIISINICLLKIFNFNIKEEDDKNLKLTMIIINIINLVLIIIYALSTKTGYYDYDFRFIWNTPLFDTSDWHTYTYTILISILRDLFNSPYISIIIQSILWFIALNYSLKILARETKNKKTIIIFSILQILILTGFKQNVYLWKDTIFTVSFYILILSIIDCIKKQKIDRINTIIFIIFGINVCNFRHGGYILIFITSIILILLLRKNKDFIKKILICSLISVSSYFAIDIIGDNLLSGYQSPDNIKYTVPLYQIGYFINDNHNFSNSDIVYLEKLYPIELWKEAFIINDADSVSRAWNFPKEYEQNYEKFDYSYLIPINLKLFINRPFTYIKSLMNLDNLLWKMTDIDIDIETSRLQINSPFNDNEFFNTQNDILHYEGKQDITFTKNQPFYNIINKLENILFNNSLFFNIKSRGGFGIYILLLSSVLFIYKKEKKYLLSVIPLFIWIILLFLSIPRSLTRYVIIFIISWPIIFLLALSKNKN